MSQRRSRPHVPIVRRRLLAALLTVASAAGCRDDSAKQGSRGPAAGTPPSPPATAPAGVPGAKPLAGIDRVVIVSLDGLRPDLIFRAGATHLPALMAAGSSSLWARTIDPPFTLPSHASMITGVKPARHHIDFNGYAAGQFPWRPTLFDEAKEQGMTTALVAGKVKLTVLARPGSVDWQWAQEAEAPAVAAEAARVLREHRPNVLMVHFADVDAAGHADGWGSPAQLAAVRRADDGVGVVVAAIDDSGLAGSTLLIVTADHGGWGGMHGADPAGPIMPSYVIPWIARGPGIYKGLDLDRFGPPGVKTEDTFATACAFLGIPLRPDLDGRPVLEIVDRTGQELMHGTTP